VSRNWPRLAPTAGDTFVSRRTRARMGEHTNQSTSKTRSAVEGFDGRLARFLVGLISADVLVIGIGIAVEANTLVVLLAHVLLLATCPWCFTFPRSRDQTPFTLSLMLVLVAGPLGGLGISLIALAERRGVPGQHLLQAWYDWLSGEEQADPTARIHDAILAGREFKPSLGGLRNFANVIENGSLAEKQALLGLIGLRYHRDYFAVLSSALRSPQSAVRAQAAAIFVKLKEQFTHRLGADRHSSRAMHPSKDVRAMFACAASILDCAESGFLDPVDVREALAEAKALCLHAASFSNASREETMILCRIIARTGEDDGLLDRLGQCALTSCAEVKKRLALCLVAAGRHVDLHRLLFARVDAGPERTSLPAPLCS
jgi:hypothetical protein